MKKVVRKALNIIVDVIVIIILITSIIVITLSLTSKSSGVPNLFGYAPLSVQSESMKDTLNEGDLIFSKVSVDGDNNYKVGDIVSFNQMIEGAERINTHRIVEVVQEDGQEYYRTQGDNKATNPEPDEELKSPKDILAVYTGTKIPGVGAFLTFIRTQLGFFLCVLLPMILFFVYEAIRVIMNIVAYNKEKAIEAAQDAVANSDLTEEQKQRAIEEYLAQQRAQEENTSEVQTPAEDSVTPDAEVESDNANT
jgi:signal peptidase